MSTLYGWMWRVSLALAQEGRAITYEICGRVKVLGRQGHGGEGARHLRGDQSGRRDCHEGSCETRARHGTLGRECGVSELKRCWNLTKNRARRKGLEVVNLGEGERPKLLGLFNSCHFQSPPAWRSCLRRTDHSTCPLRVASGGVLIVYF